MDKDESLFELAQLVMEMDKSLSEVITLTPNTLWRGIATIGRYAIRILVIVIDSAIFCKGILRDSVGFLESAQ